MPMTDQVIDIYQTYRIATSARSKLMDAASEPDHRLRVLVGHANLLDSLMDILNTDSCPTCATDNTSELVDHKNTSSEEAEFNNVYDDEEDHDCVVDDTELHSHGTLSFPELVRVASKPVQKTGSMSNGHEPRETANFKLTLPKKLVQILNTIEEELTDYDSDSGNETEDDAELEDSDLGLVQKLSGLAGETFSSAPAAIKVTS